MRLYSWDIQFTNSISFIWNRYFKKYPDMLGATKAHREKLTWFFFVISANGIAQFSESKVDKNQITFRLNPIPIHNWSSTCTDHMMTYILLHAGFTRTPALYTKHVKHLPYPQNELSGSVLTPIKSNFTVNILVNKLCQRCWQSTGFLKR